MKTIKKLFRVISIITCIFLLSSGESLISQNTEFSRISATGFSIGNKGYMGTGFVHLNGVSSSRKDFWEYDPATDSWTQKADVMGNPRADAVGFSIGSYGYIGTGWGNSNYFMQYNPAQNVWVLQNDIGGSMRGNAVAFVIGSKAYVGTGFSLVNGQTINLKDFWEFTPGKGNGRGTWKQVADLPGIARKAAVGFGIGQKGYVTTGINVVDSAHYTWYKDTWEYDPNTNPKTGGKWTQKADFPAIARAYGVGFSINGTKGYVGTGNSGNAHEGFKNDFWEYNPANTGSPWTRKADFPGAARDCAVGFSIGAKGYIGLGLFGNDYDSIENDFWQYDPGTIPGGPGSWMQKADFGLHRSLLKDAESTDIKDPASSEKLLVYPNPSASDFNFRLKTTCEELVTIQIFDMLGRLVREYKSLSPDDLMIIGENLNVGVYIAVVTQGEYRKTIKLSKVN